MFKDYTGTIKMNATIELRGGTLFACHEDVLHNVYSTQFMPGDTVSLPTFNLVNRIEQPGIAIVRYAKPKQATLYISTILPCSFAPIIQGDYVAGERLVVWFHSSGWIEVKGTYSLDATDDMKCLLHMYELIKNRPALSFVKQSSFYTEPEQDETHLDTFTIDPEHSVDFDDAISIDVTNRTLYVHIVDIANEVITSDEEKRLQERCFSLYLSNEHTEHLLDRDTASNRLSLIVGEKRKTITIRTVLDEDGNVSSYAIYPSTICVKRRYHYDQVPLTKEPFAFLVQLSRLRSKDIQYHIQLPSLRYKVKPDGYLEDLHTESMDESHELIATAMVLANVIVSTHLHKSGVSLPNRFHDTIRGIKIPENTKQTGNIHVDSFITVKRFARACYALDNRGHFGLGVSDYVHFTSPMRRYADVLVHRILAGYVYTNEELESEIRWINHRSTIVRTIQSVYTNCKIFRHLLTIPNEYEVWITSVSKNGVMWYIPAYSQNGYTHLSNILPKQFWNFSGSFLQGTSTKQEINVGDKCKGKIVTRDAISFEITLELSFT